MMLFLVPSICALRDSDQVFGDRLTDDPDASWMQKQVKSHLDLDIVLGL